jgi:hypothetical protein
MHADGNASDGASLPPFHSSAADEGNAAKSTTMTPTPKPTSFRDTRID